MSSMFNSCKSLSYLPDILKWNTNNVTDMSYMFYGCEKLNELPDISKWNINKVDKMEEMFENCFNSLIIPNKFIPK